MPVPSTLDQLLLELERGIVEPERYSRKSLYGRCEPLMLTTVLALIAITSGMLLGGAMQRPRPAELMAPSAASRRADRS